MPGRLSRSWAVPSAPAVQAELDALTAGAPADADTLAEVAVELDSKIPQGGPLTTELDADDNNIVGVDFLTFAAGGRGFTGHPAGNGVDCNGTIDTEELRADSIVLSRSQTDTGLVRGDTGECRIIREGLVGPTFVVVSAPDGSTWRMGVANDGTPVFEPTS